MNTADSVFKSIVDECEEDYVGLWSVVREVRKTLTDESGVVEATLRLIKRLLLEGDVIAGEFNTEVDDKFHPWKMPVEQVVAKIRHEWAELGREPTGGDIVWFTKAER